MASASTSNQPIDDKNGHNNTNTSCSHFQKTVVLQDWWLIRAENEFQGKTLAVAGFTSREQQALRGFSSAPICRRYDVFTLETIDGVCVLLKGFINKVRTVENGFPSEIFKHFVFGFPPYWEEYAEKCLSEVLGFGKVSPHLSVTEVAGSKDSCVETPDVNEKTIGEERHDNSEKLDSEFEDLGNILSSEEPNSLKAGACNETSTEVLEECCGGDASKGSNSPKHVADFLSCVEGELNVNIRRSGVSKNGIKTTLGISSMPENEGHTTLMADAVNDDVSGVNDDTLENPPLPAGSENLNILNGNASMEAASMESCLPKCSGADNPSPSKFNEAVFVDSSLVNLKLLSKRRNRSRKDIKYIRKGNLKNGRKNIPTVPLSRYSGDAVRFSDKNSCGINNSSEGAENESLPTAPVVENPKILEPAENYLDSTMSTRTSKLKTLRGHQEITPALRCHLENENIKYNSVSVARENPGEETSNKSPPTTTANILEKIASQSEDGMFKCQLSNSKRKLKDGQTASDRNKLNSVSVGNFDRLKNVVADINRESRGRSTLTLSEGGPQEPMDDSVVRNVDSECVNHGSDLTSRFSPGGTSLKQAQSLGVRLRSKNTSISLKQEQSCGARARSKNTNESVRSSHRLGDAKHENNLKVSVGNKESNRSMKKTKRKLTYGSPSTAGVEEKTSVVSPQSFRRSRSGRLLLPTLEFWRNQKAIYDADRQITGIQEAMPAVKPSTGSRSEPQKKRKQLA